MYFFLEIGLNILYVLFTVIYYIAENWINLLGSKAKNCQWKKNCPQRVVKSSCSSIMQNLHYGIGKNLHLVILPTRKTTKRNVCCCYFNIQVQRLVVIMICNSTFWYVAYATMMQLTYCNLVLGIVCAG